MFIRRTQTGRSSTGERDESHRLVQSERHGSKVRQSTLMNLGRHFAIPQEEWPALCLRIDELLHGVESAFPSVNAVAESFFASLKRECVQWANDQTKAEARKDILDDIAMFYNSRRLHSSLGCCVPNALRVTALKDMEEAA